MELLLIADTHVPKRAKDLPAAVWDQVARVDVVLHAGDWVTPPLLDELEGRAARLLACWGNNDGDELRSRLPERADATLDGVRFTVVHETGASGLMAACQRVSRGTRRPRLTFLTPRRASSTSMAPVADGVSRSCQRNSASAWSSCFETPGPMWMLSIPSSVSSSRI